MNYDYIVIGSGFAGTTAAIKLQTQGSVLLLEADDKVGGRTKSFEHPQDNNIKIDVGAHYIGRKHKRVMQLVKRFGLLDQLMDYVPGFGKDPIAVCHLKGRRVSTKRSETYFDIQGLDAKAPWGEQAKFFLALLSLAILCSAVNGKRPWKSLFAKKMDAISYGDFVKWFTLPEWFTDLMFSGVRCVWSQDPNKMSLLYVMWYMKTNGGFSAIFNDQDGSPQQYGLKIGLGGLLNRYLQEFRGDIKCNAVVNAVEKTSQGVTVTLSNKQSFTCKSVIVAVSPAATQNILFKPMLNPNMQAFFNQPAGFAVKAVIYYPTPWFRSTLGGDQQTFAYLNGNEDLGIDWILECSAPDDSFYAVTCFIAPNLIDKHQTGGEQAILNALKTALITLTQDERAGDWNHIEYLDWRANPFVKSGPCTNFGVNQLTNAKSALIEPQHEQIYFACADYATDFTGYVEGAMASGELAAQRILTPEQVTIPGKKIQWGFLILQLCALPFLLTVVGILKMVDWFRGK